MSTTPVPSQSLLPLVIQADHLPAYHAPYPSRHPITKQRIVPLHISFQDFQNGLPPVGLITKPVLKALEKEQALKFFSLAKEIKSCDIKKDGRRVECGACSECLQKQKQDKSRAAYKLSVLCVFFAEEINEKGKEARTEAMADILNRWKAEGRFPEATKLWMDELFPIYAYPQSRAFKATNSTARQPFGNVAFEMERAGVPLFGCQAFGVHMTAYEGEGEDMKIWIPRRSADRHRSPLKYDSSVAGGLPAKHTPLEGLLKECEEEAGWPEELIRKYVKSAGMVSYYEIMEDGAILPSTYTYDLPLPPRSSPTYIHPSPNDDEVDSFELLPVQQVILSLHKDKFKPSSAMVTIDFLVRHGFVTPDNETNYQEIVRRMHRRIDVTGPGI
ncbi:hypothetical protein L198_02660 [Cryptococcus wingfieldii CBS 7118]|uniref:Nudix hydrolase domain-containing protein n=1 Tax=Cryptococcus wingfieldii CBS 7118 TaxID=1295528 RepID=A0A1E3JM51_9TREE|nr:hypothetical protein L198_02660 [Cryptococcus wingfieldii CBS 7118]ODO01930.1 hypothetical protein L198_02660 [Cryptococcus wingfieldii CBS 7118]